MSRAVCFLTLIWIGAALASTFASRGSATVLILEGAAPSPSATEPPPGAPTPADRPSQSGQSSDTPTAPDKDSPSVSTHAAAPSPPVAPEPSSSVAMKPVDLGKTILANPAELSVEMLPGQAVSIGSVVSFKVSSKKPGYLVLVDVDAAGHLTQVYPNTASLTRTTRPNGNYLKAGQTLTIPLATDPYAGVRYVVSPPTGQAILLGVLSPLPVQILDLPDVPPEIRDNPDLVLSFLAKRTSELRIPDESNRLREANWSFNAKPYTIQ